jgi:hypothetical protein
MSAVHLFLWVLLSMFSLTMLVPEVVLEPHQLAGLCSLRMLGELGAPVWQSCTSVVTSLPFRLFAAPCVQVVKCVQGMVGCVGASACLCSFTQGLCNVTRVLCIGASTMHADIAVGPELASQLVWWLDV